METCLQLLTAFFVERMYTASKSKLFLVDSARLLQVSTGVASFLLEEKGAYSASVIIEQMSDIYFHITKTSVPFGRTSSGAFHVCIVLTT